MEIKKIILNQREILAMLGIGKTTLQRMIKAGKFPPPLKISVQKNGKNVWKVADVDSWLASQKA